MNKESLQWLAIAFIAVGLVGLGMMTVKQYAQFGQFSRSLTMLSTEVRNLSMNQNKQGVLPEPVRVDSVIPALSPTSSVVAPLEQEDVERVMDVTTIVSPAMFEKGLSTVKKITDLTSSFLLTSGETARFEVLGMSDTYTYITMKDSRQPYSASVDVVTLEVLNGRVINAWSFSTTFNQNRSTVQFTRGGFSLNAQSFDQFGRVTFIGSMFQQ